MVSFPYYSHIFRDSYGNGMGIVWVPLTISCEQADSGLPRESHSSSCLFCSLVSRLAADATDRANSQAQWLEPKPIDSAHRLEPKIQRITHVVKHANNCKNMQLSKLRGCKTYLPNYSGCAKKATLTLAPQPELPSLTFTWPNSYPRMFHIQLNYKDKGYALCTRPSLCTRLAAAPCI